MSQRVQRGTCWCVSTGLLATTDLISWIVLCRHEKHTLTYQGGHHQLSLENTNQGEIRRLLLSSSADSCLKVANTEEQGCWKRGCHRKEGISSEEIG